MTHILTSKVKTITPLEWNRDHATLYCSKCGKRIWHNSWSDFITSELMAEVWTKDNHNCKAGASHEKEVPSMDTDKAANADEESKKNSCAHDLRRRV